MFFIIFYDDTSALIRKRSTQTSQVICSCDWCGKTISMKQSRFFRAQFHYCSVKCHANHKRITFKGENNHQYGLRGPLNSTFKTKTIQAKNNHLTENLIYVGIWYRGNVHGRVKIHRYLVEKNHHLFDPSFFDYIDGWYYLKPKIEVHHIDFNHDNNDISNLLPLSKSEHIRLHNLMRKQGRDHITGKFIKNDTKRISKESS